MGWLLKYLIEKSGKKIIFPFYHIVSDEDCPHVKHLYPIKRPAQFEKELDFLQKHYRPLTLEELMTHIQNNTKPKVPSFFLSFDDGLKECYSVITPILKERGIPAVFFLNTGFMDNKDLFYRYKVSLIIDKLKSSGNASEERIKELLSLRYKDREQIDKIAASEGVDFSTFLKNESPYMTWEEVHELKEQGFYFGGHSVDHPLYSELSWDEQISQTQDSVNEVGDKLNLDYRLFSFPFSDEGVGKAYYEKIYSEGICDLTFASGRLNKDEFPKNLHRFGLEPNDGNPAAFFRKRYLVYLLNSLLNRNTITR